MIGIAVAFQNRLNDGGMYYGAEAIFFYLTAYALMTLGAFGVIVMLSTPERPVETVEDLAGLSQTHPASALAMAVCLFSLAGIPGLAGFFGKYQLIAAAFSATSGDDTNLFWWLSIIAVLNSAAGAYYYLRIVVTMYMRTPTADAITAHPPWPSALCVGLCAALTVFLGVYPTPVNVRTKLAAEASIDLPEPIDAVTLTVAPANR